MQVFPDSFVLSRGSAWESDTLLALCRHSRIYGKTKGIDMNSRILTVGFWGGICLATFVWGALPEPWQNRDIGNVGASGSCSYSNGIFTVNGSGADIWNTADEFHYVYQPYSGNVRIVAQVTSQTAADGWAKAGLMIRETLNNNSKHAMMIISPSNGSSFQYRAETGAISYHHTPYNGLTVPCRLMLVRAGNEFKGYSSANGTDWTLISSATISMSANVYIGLCVTAHNDGQISTACFQDVSVLTDSTPPSPNPAAWADTPYAVSSHTVQMTAVEGTDLSGPVEYYFEETSGHEGGSSSGWITNNTYIDYNLKPLETYTYTVRMRDVMGNESGASLPASVTTAPSPDADGNETINLFDFASFAANWYDTDCPNNLWCCGSDFDLSGTVDKADLKIFCDVWLQQTGLGHFYKWAETPPMGWNSYDCYGYAVYEHQVRENADFMHTYLQPYGWEYVVVDFCWYTPDVGTASPPNQDSSFYPHSNFDAYGRLLPDPRRFPSSAGGAGFKPLADYVHNLGLKFGIHLMRGIPREVVAANLPVKGTPYTASEIADTSNTCSWYNLMYGLKMSHPGAQAYLDSLFELYASWDVDFVKVDDLSVPYHASEIEGYRTAIDHCGRAVVFSTSPGPTPFVNAGHVSANANMWRLLSDLWDNWSQVDAAFGQVLLWKDYYAPGHWPDLDMLPMGVLAKYGPVGNERYSNLTEDECYTLMSLWCITRSPLMFGGNLPENTAFTTSLLTNPEVIAVNQSSTNNRPVYTDRSVVWTADAVNSSNEKYIALFNRTSAGMTVQVALADIGVKRCSVRDLWTHSELGEVQDTLSAAVNPHGAKLYKLTAAETASPQTPIIILNNPGFDAQILNDGSWSAEGDVWGWSADAGGNCVAQNLTTSDINPASQSGENTGVLGQQAWMGQNLEYSSGKPVSIAANKSYQVSLWIGRRRSTEGSAAGILSVYLEDAVSSTMITSATYDLAGLSQGQWIQKTFVLNTGSNPPGVGNTLRLGFMNIGTRGSYPWYGQAVLDNITITPLEEGDTE